MHHLNIRNYEHGWKTVPDLRGECKHRGLPHNGKKQELIDRLMKAKEEASTRDGKIIDYERRLKAHNERRMTEIVPFPWFSKLHYDVRHCIWEYSLPGPRTICPGSAPIVQAGPDGVYPDDTTALYFPKAHHTPNPAALSVCRESRRIALQRYRLCFGTPNVYADLGIDILYFGPWERRSSQFWEFFWQWYERIPGGNSELTSLRPEVVADLELVKYVAYKYIDGWAEYDDDERPFGSAEKGGEQLRRDLARFKGLKEVLLDCGETEGDEDEPGRTVFEDYEKSRQEEADENAELELEEADDWDFDTKLSEHKWTLIRRERAARILPEFRTKNLTPEEKERGIPKAKLVIVKRIPNVPEYVNTTRNPYRKFSEP
jgi:hypothetical protein